MSDIDKKVDDISGMLNRMEPMLSDVRDGQKEMDARMRVVEVNIGVHGVEIKRIQSDLDGLGRKVRYSAPPRPSTEGRWANFLAFLALVPAYWHVIASALMVITAFGIRMWGH